MHSFTERLRDIIEYLIIYYPQYFMIVKGQISNEIDFIRELFVCYNVSFNETFQLRKIYIERQIMNEMN